MISYLENVPASEIANEVRPAEEVPVAYGDNLGSHLPAAPASFNERGAGSRGQSFQKRG